MKRLFVLGSVVIALFSSIVMTSCEKDDEEKTNNEQYTDYHYWKSYPNSYIKMCDWRMNFRFTECKRVDGGVYIQYVLTNTGFDKKVMLGFNFPSSPAHDDLGNTYKSNTQGIVGMIDGKNLATGTNVEFLPNQAIKGSFTIRDFDINATAVSVSMKVNVIQPQSEYLMYNNIEFVNVPLDCNPDTLIHM